MMHYKNIVEGVFLSRPNRFIAICNVNDNEVIAHVKNTGRCQELLISGAVVYLEHSPSPSRKTDYSLIAVIKNDRLINIDSQAPNKILYEALTSGYLQLPDLKGSPKLVKKEFTYGKSRIDFYIETTAGEKVLIEVKGVTLEEDNIVKFPDAPTARGAKHLAELSHATSDGYKCYVVFIVQLKNVLYFTPNIIRDSLFYGALKAARNGGVNLLAYDCYVTPEEISLKDEVFIQLS